MTAALPPTQGHPSGMRCFFFFFFFFSMAVSSCSSAGALRRSVGTGGRRFLFGVKDGPAPKPWLILERPTVETQVQEVGTKDPPGTNIRGILLTQVLSSV